jgi:hypothetical protein
VSSTSHQVQIYWGIDCEDLLLWRSKVVRKIRATFIDLKTKQNKVKFLFNSNTDYFEKDSQCSKFDRTVHIIFLSNCLEMLPDFFNNCLDLNHQRAAKFILWSHTVSVQKIANNSELWIRCKKFLVTISILLQQGIISSL